MSMQVWQFLTDTVLALRMPGGYRSPHLMKVQANQGHGDCVYIGAAGQTGFAVMLIRLPTV